MNVQSSVFTPVLQVRGAFPFYQREEEELLGLQSSALRTAREYLDSPPPAPTAMSACDPDEVPGQTQFEALFRSCAVSLHRACTPSLPPREEREGVESLASRVKRLPFQEVVASGATDKKVQKAFKSHGPFMEGWNSSRQRQENAGPFFTKECEKMQVPSDEDGRSASRKRDRELAPAGASRELGSFGLSFAAKAAQAFDNAPLPLIHNWNPHQKGSKEERAANFPTKSSLVVQKEDDVQTEITSSPDFERFCQDLKEEDRIPDSRKRERFLGPVETSREPSPLNLSANDFAAWQQQCEAKRRSKRH